MHRLFVPLILAASAINPSFAQPAAPPLTLAQAVSLAIANHPELRAAEREIEAAGAARDQAGVLLPNPTLGIELEDTRRETRTTTLLLSQPIELGGKRAARIAAAERARDVARAQRVQREIELRAAVTSAYLAALVAEERVALAEALLGLAKRGSEAAGKRVAAGKVSPVEETRARVATAGVAVELAQARSERAAGLHALRAAIGVPGLDLSRLDGSAQMLPPAARSDDLEQRLADAPALRVAALEADRQGALAAIEQSKRMPDITLTLGAKRAAELGRDQAVLGISVPLPIFDSNRGNQREALRREDKAREEAEALALRLRAEALAARERLDTARLEAETLAREVLPGAQSAFEAATRGFELGKFSFLEALDAQRTLFQARAQHLKALGEAHRAAAELDRLIGTPAAHQDKDRS
ncbi:cobalt-zinc-cadmium efflux system outer membrane protein [Variovorax sp. TBS-050B]|uniref:TolC family protein n=1 Tax=Variovorax sp. TBS-050B TaxID=2940551 RepID=UPI002476CEF2|nr:TolC family protein [Variovorax sp. TBS-050B]MDH6590236.1 cobalt-zinc-cadmium efflux system outer membrane protein [Variovorax sp. TBS-050B]